MKNDVDHLGVRKGDAEHKARISVGLGKLLDTEIKHAALEAER